MVGVSTSFWSELQSVKNDDAFLVPLQRTQDSLERIVLASLQAPTRAESFPAA